MQREENDSRWGWNILNWNELEKKNAFFLKKFSVERQILDIALNELFATKTTTNISEWDKEERESKERARMREWKQLRTRSTWQIFIFLEFSLNFHFWTINMWIDIYIGECVHINLFKFQSRTTTKKYKFSFHVFLVLILNTMVVCMIFC